MSKSAPSPKRYLFLATLILLVAVSLRLWQLADLPPGPHYDEAVNLIAARSIAFGGARFFPILEAYQGREVLYFYLNAPLLTLIHDSMFPFHLTNAFLNLLTIAASIGFGRAIFPGWRGVFVGLTMGVLMAISFPQLWLGRQAFRAVTLPFCQAMALLFLWRGLRRRTGYGWLIAGGAFAGLALYTYMASRLFPLWLVIGGLVLVVADRRNRVQRVRQGAVFFGVLIVVALPMLIYAVQRPDIFFNRLSEVTSDVSITLIESVVLHLRMFFIEGDPYLRYNIPGRPYLTLPEGLLMLIGIGVCGWQLLKSHTRPTEKAAYALALIAPLMVTPSVISIGGLPPSHMRSLGMIPLIFLLVAMGAEAVFRRVVRRKPRWLAVVIVTALIVGSVAVSAEYFAWVTRPDVYVATDADLAAAAAWTLDHQQAGEIVYVAARDRGHPTFMIANVPNVTWLGTDSLTFPPPGESGLYIFPRSAPPTPRYRALLESSPIADVPLAPDGLPAFEAFRTTAQTLSFAETARNAYLTVLNAATLNESFASGELGDFVLAWRVDQAPPSADFTPLVQLVDSNGFVLARAAPYLTETHRWRRGEVVLEHMTVEVPIGTAPGVYSVHAAWVAQGADQYTPFMHADGTQSGVWAEIGTLTVTPAVRSMLAADLPVAIRTTIDAAPGIQWVGYERVPDEVRPGETIPVMLSWYAAPLPDGTTRRDIQTRILLGDTPLEGEWSVDHPASAWRDGEGFVQRGWFTIPRDQAAGQVELRVEINSTPFSLGFMNIAGTARLFDPPPVERVIDLAIGDALRIRGVTVHEDVSGVTLDIVWQAVDVVDTNYTVFVHALDANGTIIAQYDAMPHLNEYPTSLWLTGEFVMDSIQLPDVQPQVIHIGLYDQTTGFRLNVGYNDLSLHVNYIEIPMN